MKYKTIISFLIFAVISITVYLTVSTFFDLSRQRKNYGVTVLSPSVSFRNVKNYQSRNRITAPVYQNNIYNNNSSASGLTPVAIGSQTLARTSGSVKPNTFNSEQANGAISGSTYSGTTSAPSNGNSSGFVMSFVTGSRSSRTATTSNPGMLALSETKSSSSPTYEPFSGGTSGLPDPGGNADDSCEDDIVFLPVSDGLPFLIFLTLIYALIKFLRDKVNSQRLYTKTLYTPGLNTEGDNK